MTSGIEADDAPDGLPSFPDGIVLPFDAALAEPDMFPIV
jgi:hypothetical protein